jgi:hypothetical protein
MINNKKIIYLVLFAFTCTIPLALLLLPQINLAASQLDPSQDPIEPIPPSNNTNSNQTVPIIYN